MVTLQDKNVNAYVVTLSLYNYLTFIVLKYTLQVLASYTVAIYNVAW